MAYNIYHRMMDTYRQEARPIHQILYLTCKQPREIWNPTLWEIPLQSHPKSHKAHWDLSEWEIPLM